MNTNSKTWCLHAAHDCAIILTGVNISVVNGPLFDVNENVGSLRIFLEADHALETTITVTLTTTSVTAIGECIFDRKVSFFSLWDWN